MKDCSDLSEFIANRERLAQELRHMNALVKKYKKQTPTVTPIWDLSESSIAHNNICTETIESGLILFIAPFADVWSGIYEPSIYDRETLWKKIHDNTKIARIIEHWNNNQKLSPIFLVKHGRKELGLVADGKHRLTVARYMDCDYMPFMVPSSDSGWVSVAIPSATKYNNSLITSPP